MQEVVKEVKVIRATKGLRRGEKIRVAAYCRVSTDKDDQLNSFFAQMRYYTDYVRANDKMELVDIYADEGITGTELAKREEMKRLIRDCRCHRIDRVVVKSVQRFARNSLECLETIREMQSCGVSVLFENDHIDTETMNSEMMLYIKSAFAQMEATSASKRMSTSIRMRMEDGTFVAPSVPYGYRMENNELIVIPSEAENIRKIFKWYLEGYGAEVISQRMQIIDKTKYWSRLSIRYILKNEKYIGDSLWQKFYTPSVLPFRNKINRGEKPKYYCEGTQEAIVSKEDFYAARRLMEEREGKHVKETKSERKFFQGKIFCRNCGWVYKPKYGKYGYRWGCSKKGYGLEKCICRTYSDDDAQSAFIRLYNILKQNRKVLLDETILQLQALKMKANGGNNEISQIDEEVATLNAQNSLYSQMFNSGVLEEVTYLEKSSELQSKIAELRAKRLKIISMDDEENTLEELRSLKRLLEEEREYIDEMDCELFNKLVKKIYAEKDGALTFEVKGGVELTVRMEEENGE